MSYTGQRITDLIPDDYEAITADACERMADDAGRFALDVAVATAPVSAFGRPPGELKASYEQIPVHRGEPSAAGERTYVSGVESRSHLARWAEYGVSPHDIRPKIRGGVIRFRTVGGEMVEARVVHHPGTHGKHIVSRAIHETAFAFDELARPALDDWARRMSS
jgi:hypothetical protein